MNIARQIKKTVAAVATTMMDIASIRTDGGTQSRAIVQQLVVDEYTDAIKDGAAFPAVVIFYDGSDHWLADGFHRFHAYRSAGRDGIPADVRQGTRRDAILYSVGANETHGLRRTNDDKRRAVMTLLNDADWSKWSDREIARLCAVGYTLVAKLRPDVTARAGSDDRTYNTKHGKPATMNTSAIGKTASTPEPSPQTENLPAPVDHTAFHEEARESLPQAVKDMEAAKRQAIADRKNAAPQGDLTAEECIAELEENIRLLEIENEVLKVEVKTFAEMRAQFEQGGFDKVVADKDELIRVLETRVAAESQEKVRNLNAMERWKREAIKRGWTKDVTIPLDDPAEGALDG